MGKHKDKKHKPKKEKKKKQKKKYSSSSDSCSTEDEWVEKSLDKPQEKPDNDAPSKEREDWFSLPANFLTASNKEMKQTRVEAKRLEKQNNQYNPSSNARELNPYWKDNGTGLPSNISTAQFKRPTNNDDDDLLSSSSKHGSQSSSSSRSHSSMMPRKSNWQKTNQTSTSTHKMAVDETNESTVVSKSETISEAPFEEDTKILSQKELNALAAKLVKAEIMGNTTLMKELTDKLATARQLRVENPEKAKEEDVILTQTDSKGYSRPLKAQNKETDVPRAKKPKMVETHISGERQRYFADDDKYTLKEMFEHEKFNTAEKQNEEFISIMGKNKNDDLDEIFTDKIRKPEADGKTDRRNRDKAIAEHQKMVRTLDNCNKCPQATNVHKHLIVAMGSNVYLSLPSHEPLTDGHCTLVPTKHTICSTQLDENEWEEIMDYRKALTKMYASRGEDVIFFEVARNFHRFHHMVIECVPIEREVGDLAPIYFKKAIDESETEWATNKKLISLKGKNVRRAVPKGLPYFFVSFGMQEGYAHVIEDEESFPANFAQEIIGGMLDLHHSKWRNPKRQSFQEQSERVANFTKLWTLFDFDIDRK